jgi:hypothetical protein
MVLANCVSWGVGAGHSVDQFPFLVSFTSLVDLKIVYTLCSNDSLLRLSSLRDVSQAAGTALS